MALCAIPSIGLRVSTRELHAHAARAAEQRRSADSVEDLVAQALSKMDVEGFTLHEVYRQMFPGRDGEGDRTRPINKGDEHRIADALRQLGLERSARQRRGKERVWLWRRR